MASKPDGGRWNHPRKFFHAIIIFEPPSPVLIGIFANYPPCGLNASQKVANKRKSTSPELVRHTQKLDAVVDGKLPDDLDSASIFSKVIGHILSDGSSGNLYSHCRTNFAAGPVQTQRPKLMDLGSLTINELDESSGLSNPATRIQSPVDGSHWSAPYHVFGQATVLGMSKAKSDHDYNLFFFLILVRSPWPHSVFIIGWWNSNPEQRL